MDGRDVPGEAFPVKGQGNDPFLLRGDEVKQPALLLFSQDFGTLGHPLHLCSRGESCHGCGQPRVEKRIPEDALDRRLGVVRIFVKDRNEWLRQFEPERRRKGIARRGADESQRRDSGEEIGDHLVGALGEEDALGPFPERGEQAEREALGFGFQAIMAQFCVLNGLSIARDPMRVKLVSKGHRFSFLSSVSRALTTDEQDRARPLTVQLRDGKRPR